MRALGAAVLAGLLAVAVYANTLPNDLVYDDLGVITVNPAVRDPLDWRRIALTPSWFAAPSREHRPLTTWTFALNHAAHGARPFGYHLVNVLLHAAVSAGVVVLATTFGATVVAAALAGALFAVHPIHTEAVAWAVGRAELLAAAFALLVLLAARRVGRSPRPALATLAAAGAYAGAIAAKEHTIALLALVPLAHLLLDDDGSPRTFLRRLPGRRLVLYLALAALTAGYLGLRRAALGDLVGEGGLGTVAFWQNPLASADWRTRLLTALAVHARGLWLLFVPLGLSADYSFRQIPVVTSVAEPRALLGLAVALGLVALAAAFVRRRRWLPLFWLLLAWLAYLPVSNVPFPIGTIFAERLLYLPSVGFCVLLAAALTAPPSGRRRALGLGVGLCLVAAFATGTWVRNRVWHDDLALAEATVASAPASTHAHYLLGAVYAQRGREEDAVAEFRRAVDILPTSVNPLYNLGVIAERQGRAADATAAFARVVELNPRHVLAWSNLALLHNREGRFAEALTAADRALAIRPSLASAHVGRGTALGGLGRAEEARRAFTNALALEPGNLEARSGLAALGGS